MTLKIEIEMENAAFEDGAGGLLEAARILKGLVQRMESGSGFGRLLDVNGNRVGKAEVVE